MQKILIRADESADWIVAGLRQLDRILRVLEEAFPTPLKVWIVWEPAVAPARRWLPKLAVLSSIELQTTDSPGQADVALDTRMFLGRNLSAAEIAEISQNPTVGRAGYEYLENSRQIVACEKRFLRGTGKSQDGFVSRFVNRPVSRALSRLLLRWPISPSIWTLAICVFPLIGAWFLLRGDYRSIVFGLLFFQLYSMLDGCDGEIARAKYLESPSGRRLDTYCDIAGNLLLAVSLGYGLASFYFVEGLVVAVLIVTNESILALGKDRPLNKNSALYPRHEQMIARSGLLYFGERFAWWLIQLTKRDVALLAFLLLALAGQAGWILHSLGVVAAISSLLALKSLAAR